MFLLDTNAVIALMRGDESVTRRVRQHRPLDFALSSIVVHELYYGAHKSRRIAENLARVEALRFPILPFDREDAHSAGQLRAHLTAIGTPIGPYDSLIAGQALARDLTLITHNSREFSQVTGLKTEDWEV